MNPLTSQFSTAVGGSFASAAMAGVTAIDSTRAADRISDAAFRNTFFIHFPPWIYPGRLGPPVYPPGRPGLQWDFFTPIRNNLKGPEHYAIMPRS